MAKHEGLLIKIDSEGNISGYMQENDNKIPIQNTTIKDELISFTEYEFKDITDIIGNVKKTFRTYKKSKERYNILRKLTLELSDTISKYKHYWGLLGKLMIEDYVGEDDGTEDYVNEVFGYLGEILTIQFLVNHLFHQMSDGIEINFKEHFMYDRVEIPIVFYIENNKFESMYHIRNLTEYYFLLIHLFIKHDYKVCRCQFCGRYFVPKTKKRTLYCDRVLNNGKTCKELAPRLKHRILANRNEVLKAFDTQRSKMYKRYERTLNSSDTVEKPLSFDEYYEWLEKAREARDSYLDKIISKDRALDIICIE